MTTNYSSLFSYVANIIMVHSDPSLMTSVVKYTHYTIVVLIIMIVIMMSYTGNY